MTDDDNKNSNPDFEDDIFDETSYDESYYEDDAVYEEADLSEEDADFDDVDFDETDWGEEEDAPLAGKREKSLYRSEKKPFLNFNTIVIIGAFVVGAGVLVFTVMGQSSKVSSGIVPKFISSLNISDVMDGGLFGIGEKQDQPVDTAQTSDVNDQPAVQETGFLDDPEGLELQATGNNDLPPQPSPISPTETETVLTPMPEILPTDVAQPSANVPRAPEGMISATGEEEMQEEVVQIPATPDASQSSAEDILKRALANRGQKQQEDSATKVALEEKKPEVPASIPAPEPKPEPVPVAVPPKPSVPKTASAVVPTPAPAPVVSSEAQESVKSLETKLDTILKRMEHIETELSSVREGRENEYENLQKTVTSLKGDITTLKNAPVPKAAPVASATQTAPAAPKVEAKKAPEPIKRPAVTPKREEPAYSAPKPVVQQPAQAATWELRAAQPGKAWVSKTGQRDMQGVVVGDTVPGIGRITAISYQNSRWVVSGTQGQIRQ